MYPGRPRVFHPRNKHNGRYTCAEPRALMRPHFPREYIASSRSLLSSSILIRASNETGQRRKKKERPPVGLFSPLWNCEIIPLRRYTIVLSRLLWQTFCTFFSFQRIKGNENATVGDRSLLHQKLNVRHGTFKIAALLLHNRRTSRFSPMLRERRSLFRASTYRDYATRSETANSLALCTVTSLTRASISSKRVTVVLERRVAAFTSSPEAEKRGARERGEAKGWKLSSFMPATSASLAQIRA